MMLSVVFWIILFALFTWAFIQWGTTRTKPKEGNTPDIAPGLPSLEILRQRYARGEINAVTFEQMREQLEASYWQNHPGRPEFPYQVSTRHRVHDKSAPYKSRPELLKEDRPTRWVE